MATLDIQSNPRSNDAALLRLILTLTKLDNNEMPTQIELADEFNVSLRTIQRDISEKLIYFPIEKTKDGRLFFTKGFSLKRRSFEELEMILLSLSLSMMKGLGPSFEKATNSALKKLFLADFSSPYMMKNDPHEHIDVDSSKMNDLEFAIKNNRVTNISVKDQEFIVEPYKIVSIDEVWHLYAKDIKDDEVKVFFISDLKKVNYQTSVFELKSNMEEVLSNVHSSWFRDGVSFEVTVKVSKKIAHHFQRKKHFATQKIEQTNNDGSLIVSFDVSSDEEVDNLIKSWLPDIEVVSPKRIRDKVLDELDAYIKSLKDK